MKKYYVHQLRVEGSAYFGPSYPIAVCDNKENAQRIADSLNNDRNENVLFAYSVFEVETESVSDDILEKNANHSPIWKSCPNYKYTDMVNAYIAGYREKEREI